MANIEWFEKIGIDDVPHVGGKNASLGEMYRELGSQGVKVPNGFATTAEAFREFLTVNDLDDEIAEIVDGWDRSDVDDLATRAKQIRSLILGGSLPERLPGRRRWPPIGSCPPRPASVTSTSPSGRAPPPRTSPRRRSRASRRPT